MISKDFFIALDELEKKSKIKKEEFVEALQTALTSAFKRHNGEANDARVELNTEKNQIRVFSYKTVVEVVEDPDKQIDLDQAKAIKKNAKLGDNIEKEETPKDFGRIAVQTAKQVIMQKLREAEKENAIAELSEKEDQLITGIVKRIDGKNVYIEIGSNQFEALMNEQDQIPGEKYYINQRLKVYVKKIKDSFKGPLVQVSRGNLQFVKKLFELEIPEIQNGEVEIKSIAREAGYRTKVAIVATSPSIDAVGSCVGNKGMRINNIVNELNGEKIDIILFSENPAEFVMRALSPAKVISVEYNEEENRSLAIVPDDKLSLAIGKEGQNVRLAARLTNSKIDVKSQTQAENNVPKNYEKPTEEVAKVNENLNLDEMFKDDINE